MIARRSNQCIYCYDVQVAELYELQDFDAFRCEPISTYPMLSILGPLLFPNHPTPKVASLRLGDALIELDDRRNAWTIRQMRAYPQMNHEFVGKIPAVIQLDGEEMNIVFKVYKFSHCLN